MAKRKRRRYTPEFKAEVVLEALSGESSQAELCRRHNLSEQQLSKWKQQVVENVASVFASTDKHSSEATERIAQLEQLVGRLTLALLPRLENASDSLSHRCIATNAHIRRWGI